MATTEVQPSFLGTSPLPTLRKLLPTPCPEKSESSSLEGMERWMDLVVSQLANAPRMRLKDHPK